jgi:serine/threonine-protein kinase
MGAIYKVRHRLLDEVRVVKVIRAHMEPTGENGERFLREAKVAIRLRHPNIAVLHDFAVADDGNAFIVMEFIDGLNLLEILQGYGPPPISLSLEVARQSLRALGYLHRQKIVHRDVSPDNLMLTRDVDGHTQVKLIDLGIAKAFGAGGAGTAGLTTAGIFLGKPRYAAPEQFGTSPLDARSDLYSFGIVLYELLTGRSPITGQDPASFMAGHLFRPPVPFEETDPRGLVPGELRQAVLRALAKRPEERFESAEDFVWALTLLQDRFPLTGRELGDVFENSSPALTQPVPLPAQGSTQDKLDREFLMTQTPAPAARTEKLTAPSPAPRLVEPPPPVSPVVDVDATRVMASAPARQREESLLDATWMTVPRPAQVLAEAPVQAEGSGKTLRTVLMAAAAILLVAAVWLGWRMLSQRRVPAPAAVPASLAASPAPASAPPVETPPPPVSSAPISVQATPIATPAPSPTPAVPAKTPPRPVVPKDEAVVDDVDVIGPMQPGDLIRPGLPNVQGPDVNQLASPAYPASALGSGKRVTVKLRVLVDENGKVIDVRVQDSGGPELDAAALEAARRTTYYAATRDEIPGKMWTDLIFEFGE